MHFIFHIIYTKFTISIVSRNELCRIGLSNLWHAQQSLCKEHLVIIKQRMYDIAKQEFDEILHTSTKCNLYQYLVHTFYIQTYII
jgi:hypothetical protein